MPSPFPGMDPYLEGPDWEDFHHRLITTISDCLTPSVRPNYVVRAERRVYLEHDLDSDPSSMRPDVSVLRKPGKRSSRAGAAGPSIESPSPVLLTLPMTEEHREAFLVLRLRESMEIVTVIEVLSPANKRAGSDGRREYLAKRESVLRSATHLVELDLLRGGRRLPTVEPLPSGDYYAFVSRGNRRPRTEAFVWTLRDRLSAIPVPLAGKDPDVMLDLASAIDSTYDRAGYDYSLDYARRLVPSLRDSDAAWARGILRRRNASGR